jgi:hypothetical protein
MRPATLAALALVVVLSADATRDHRTSSPDDTCGNNCIASASPTPDDPTKASAIKDTKGTARHQLLPVDANGNRAVGIVKSQKTGAHARVGAAYSARFQAYIDDLETNYGARVLFMGGIRPGRCSRSSEHPCGKALDVCQRRRGVVDPRCNLPDRVALGKIAASHGLFEGGRWCNSDYGHAQVAITATCGQRRVRMVQH